MQLKSTAGLMSATVQHLGQYAVWQLHLVLLGAGIQLPSQSNYVTALLISMTCLYSFV